MFRSTTLVAMTVSAVLVLTSRVAEAATITWTSTPYINTPDPLKDLMGTGQFDESGIQVYVENTGGAAGSFDGITYSAGAINFGSSSDVFHASNLVSDKATFGTGGAKTVTLGAGGVGTVVEDRIYRVQLLFIDARPAENGNYVEVDGIDQGVFGNGVSGVTFGDALLVTGLFQADANTQTFTIEYFDGGTDASRGGILNALLLHQVVVPEPNSFVLAGLGMLGLGLRHRRRRRA